MAIHHEQHFPQSDPLFCEEQQSDLSQEHERDDEQREIDLALNNPPQFPLFFPKIDQIGENEEFFLSLFTKERETQLDLDPNHSIERKLAVDWMIRVNSHYGFANLTAILAVNYMDRFVERVELEREKPWMMQLVAVTCLSLAAKVEETKVPLLLDFQVEGAKYLFEAKTIERMELLVFSTLEWRMNPVTPLSFVDYIIIKLGLKFHLNGKFLRRCETLLLSVIPDLRFVGYLPSVLAASTMLHVIQQVESCNQIDYRNELLCALKLTWEKVNDCYQLMGKLHNAISGNLRQHKQRKYEQVSSYTSTSADSSDPNDTWSIDPSVISSSPKPQPYKKIIRSCVSK